VTQLNDNIAGKWGTQVKIGKLIVPANASIIAEDLHLKHLIQLFFCVYEQVPFFFADRGQISANSVSEHKLSPRVPLTNSKTGPHSEAIVERNDRCPARRACISDGDAELEIVSVNTRGEIMHRRVLVKREICWARKKAHLK
jgi:hypothetical protein